LTKSASLFSLTSILFLSSGILSSTSSTLLEWLSTVFFCLTKGTFYFQDFCLILFFLDFPYLCSTPLLYLVLSSFFKKLLTYSHVHTLFGSFLPPAPPSVPGRFCWRKDTSIIRKTKSFC
jgi:hypothetical protein